MNPAPPVITSVTQIGPKYGQQPFTEWELYKFGVHILSGFPPHVLDATRFCYYLYNFASHHDREHFLKCRYLLSQHEAHFAHLIDRPLLDLSDSDPVSPPSDHFEPPASPCVPARDLSPPHDPRKRCKP